MRAPFGHARNPRQRRRLTLHERASWRCSCSRRAYARPRPPRSAAASAGARPASASARWATSRVFSPPTRGVGASCKFKGMNKKVVGKWTRSENGGRSLTDDIIARVVGRRKWADPRPRALAGSGQSLNANVTRSGAGTGHVLCYDRRYFWAGCLLVDKVVSARAASVRRRGETRRGGRTATASAGWRTAVGRTCTCARQQTSARKQRRMGARTARRCRIARRAGSRAASCSWAPRAPLSLSAAHHPTSPNESTHSSAGAARGTASCTPSAS
jgi:hypothetical protein